MKTTAPVVPNLPYFFQSVLSPSGSSLGLNVANFSYSPGTPVILWPWQGGRANELWQVTDDGFITSLMSSKSQSLYLSPANDGNTVVTSTTSYEWKFLEPGFVLTTDGKLALAVQNTGTEPGTPIILQPVADGIAAASWLLFPNVLAPTLKLPRWCYIASGLKPTDLEVVYGLYVDQNSPSTPAILGPIKGKSPNDLWMVTPDGRILSNVGISLGTILSLGGPNSNGPGYNVVIDSQQIPAPDAQLWDLNAVANGILNKQSNQYLVVQGGTSAPISPQEGDPILTAPGIPNLSYEWSLAPSCPLDPILAQAPIPFPAFEGEELAAYVYINEQLREMSHAARPFDLRRQYTNLDAPLAGYLTDLKSLNCPKHIDQTDWTVVVDQLNTELINVQAVQALFANYSNYHLTYFDLQSNSLHALISAVGLEQGTNTSGVAAAVMRGVLNAALEAIPEVGDVLGNLVNTAIDGALADQTVSISPFSVAIEELYIELNNTFSAVLQQMMLMETVILSDWGKLQATYQKTSITDGPDSLAWPTDTFQLDKATSKGFNLAVLQILFPAKYQIYKYKDTNGDAIHGVPTSAQHIDNDGGGTWTKYWVADSTDWGAYPDQTLLGDLWSSGVSAWNFFHCESGWSFATCYVYKYMIPTDMGVVVTVTNNTPNPICVSATAKHGSIEGAASQTITPFVSVQFAASAVDREFEMALTVTDPNQNMDTIGAFEVTLDPEFLEGPWPVVSNQSASHGYALSQPILNQAAMGANYPAAVQIGVFLSNP